MSYQIRKNDTPNTRQAKKSAKHDLKRKFKKYDPKKKLTILDARKDYDRDVETFLKVNARKISAREGRYIELDKDFCLFENPNSVLFRLACLIQHSKSESKQGELRYKNRISFGAIYLLDSFYHRIREKKKWNIATQNLEHEDLLFLNQLKSFKNQDEDTTTRHIVNARIKINRDEYEIKKREYDKCSTQVRSIIEQGISEAKNENYILPLREHNVISSAITEHFDNIFQHAKKAKFGNVCGYYNRVNPEVRIIIYNFGETIFETLSGNLPPDMKAQINHVLDIHTSKNFFLFGQNFTRENALTLLAIQEGISSKLTDDKSRGHGLTDFIEHCFELTDQTRIRIISGNTAIKIDSKYKLSKMNFLGRERRIIAFNENNDIFEKPDPNHVETMAVKFPGVIIETQIPLTIN
jgi:hypothetical protein